MNLGALIRKLGEQGLTPGQIAEAVDALTGDIPVYDLGKMAASEASRERKKKADRERLADKRQKRDKSATPSENVDATPPATSATEEIPSRDDAQVVTPSSSLRSEGYTPSQEPSVPSSLAKPKAGKPKPQKWTIVSTDWHPKDAHHAKAAKLGLSEDDFTEEIAKFREWEYAVPKTDPDLSFHRWLREAAKRKETLNGHRKPTDRINQRTATVFVPMANGAQEALDRRRGRWGFN